MNEITIDTHRLGEVQASLPCLEGKKEEEKHTNMGQVGWSLRPRGYPVTRFPFTVLPVTTGLSRGPRDAQCPA